MYMRLVQAKDSEYAQDVADEFPEHLHAYMQTDENDAGNWRESVSGTTEQVATLVCIGDYDESMYGGTATVIRCEDGSVWMHEDGYEEAFC